MARKYLMGAAAAAAATGRSGDESTVASVAFEAAALANANRGGENVATGALIGAILGAHCGAVALPGSLMSGLNAASDRAGADEDIALFVAASPFANTAL